MNRDTTRLLLAFYPNQVQGKSALQRLRRNGFHRLAAIQRPRGSSLRLTPTDIAVHPRTWISAVIAVLAATLAFLATQSLLHLGVAAIVAFLVAYMVIRWLGFGVRTRLLLGFGRRVLPGESLLLAQVPVNRVSDALALLRGADHPVTFSVRPSGDIGELLEPTQPAYSLEALPSERLKAYGRELAEKHCLLPKQRPKRFMLARLRASEKALETAIEDLADATRLEQGVTAAAEWLLDNAYIVRDHIASIRRELPKDYHRELPGLAGNLLAGNLRVCSLANELVSHTGARINQNNITEFLESYQIVCPLTIAELWIFPLMLRFVLIQELERLSQRISQCQHQKDWADFWANQRLKEAHGDPALLSNILAGLQEEPLALEPHFVARLTEQLREDESALVPVQNWLEERIGVPVAELIRADHGRQASDQILIASAITSLRQISQLDFKEIFESVSRVEAILREDPAGVYARMDFRTRDRCRSAVAETARRCKASELMIARLAVEFAAGAAEADDVRQRHVGYYLLDEGLMVLEARVNCKVSPRKRTLRMVGRHPSMFYLGSVSMLTAALVSMSLVAAHVYGSVNNSLLLALLGLLAVFPCSEIAIHIVHNLITSIFEPRVLPKMSFEKAGIPDECRTLVVVPMMLLTPDSIRNEIEKLEVRYLANRDNNLYFSLLSDFTDAPEATMPEDALLLSTTITSVEELNARYGNGRFLLFHRPRSWSESEQCWIGRERKRGKLEELNAWLNGEVLYSGKELLRVGPPPPPISFVLTLDSDTQLPSGTARRLVETIAHPLNRVVIDSQTRVRRQGFTIIQPRVSIALPAATATRFTRFFSDNRGTDPYCQAVSDVYQDLFGEAIYHGKAIYDVRAFHHILTNRFPEETLLSHDLIEGVYVGVGLASDIELFEEFPRNYQSYSKRQHRWTRGDWQIFDWFLPHVPTAKGSSEPNPLSAISRWKIFDNLRRSLVSCATVLLLIVSWLASAAPMVWSLLIGLLLVMPALGSIGELFRQKVGHAWLGAGTQLNRVVASTALLPHQAWISLSAIIHVWVRRLGSRRGMLEWETAEIAHLYAPRLLNVFLLQSLVISAGAVSLLLLLAHFHSGWLRVGPALPYLWLWIVSPIVIYWLSRQEAPPRDESLSDEDCRYLRQVARQTWRYFDDLVGPQTNWLPPDNSQEALRIEVAQRTSPTNIGFGMLSALSAWDFGYLTTDQLAERCSSTMTTLEKLARHRGHLLNWYDTQSLEPLYPRYVSTVDSGNLLASLWVLEQGCRECLASPVLRSTTLRGLADTLACVKTTFATDTSVDAAFEALNTLFNENAAGLEAAKRIRLAGGLVQELVQSLRWSVPANEERVYWITRLERQMSAWTTVVDRYLRWAEVLALAPAEFLQPLGTEAMDAREQVLSTVHSLESLANSEIPSLNFLIERRSRFVDLPERLASWLQEVSQEYTRARALAVESVAQMEELITQLHELGAGMQMGFLYDSEHRVFSIGYNLDGPTDTSSHYDLLASEARLASLIAIAKGDVPIEHWMALRRPYAAAWHGHALLSWNGSMFEYLMPLLFNRTYRNSLLDDACRQAVASQIKYGEKRGIPWGISESAFSALDSQQTYQYRAFGVPDLALKRSAEDDLVVSPYATMLALPIAPKECIENLRRLADSGMSGRMGFYEAIDFTRQGKREGGKGVIVYAHMAHHQGMSLMALNNILNDNVMPRRLHCDLRFRAIQTLLFERIPPSPPLIASSPSGATPTPVLLEAVTPTTRVVGEDTPVPHVHLLGNERYSLMITNGGGGYSRWHDFDITRWRADTTRDNWGSFCYLRDLKTGDSWSTTFHPLCVKNRRYEAAFSADRVEFRRRDFGIETLVEVTVSPTDDAEIRRISLTNRTSRTCRLEVTSLAELALAPHAADRAHPAFSKLFVQTEAVPDLDALLAWRRARAPEEPPVFVGSLLACPDARGAMQYETDRAVFIGRGRDAHNPVGLAEPLSNSTGTVLDPVFCLRRRLTIRPSQRVQLQWVTVAADTKESVLWLLEKYRDPEACQQAFDLAWNHAQLELRTLGIGPDTGHRFQELAGYLIYPHRQLRAPTEHLRRNSSDLSGLYSYGISGDWPILLVSVTDSRGINLVRETLQMHTYLRLQGFKSDLVVLNQEPTSYEQPLHQALLKLIQANTVHTGMDIPGGVFLRKADQIPERELNLLFAAAPVSLRGTRGSMLRQLRRPIEIPQAPLLASAISTEEEPSPALPFLELPYFNGLGGFTPDGREYAIYLGPKTYTPLPWVNVMAHPTFGACVSESGSGFVWHRNSQMNRLTPWQNDPVGDPSSEAIYIRDVDSGALWTPTPLPIRENDAYRARHGQGYTVFEHNSHSIEQILMTFVPMNEQNGEPIRVQRLQLRNRSFRRQRLIITSYSEWTLGGDRENNQLHVVTDWDAATNALLARNAANGQFGQCVAFAALSPSAMSYTGDRTAFLGRNGSLRRPAALDRAHLAGRVGPGLDPCAALQTRVELNPGEEKSIILLLGQGEGLEHARALVRRYSDPGYFEQAVAQTQAWWDRLLTTINIETPIMSLNFLLNRWLVYQTLSCRIWGRSAVYQSGGAFGFRDQLQDVMALVYSAPEIAREHILRCASRQFEEGDVQHWWHEPSGNGIRSRCSDDLLWLPFVTSHYVEVTGDTGILDARAGYLEGPVLGDSEHERYFAPMISNADGTLFEHCQRAIEKGLTTGPHGLPLIGTGDWNDGLNRVGVEGKGESVWLGWFLIDVLKKFAGLCDRRAKTVLAEAYRNRADQIAAAIESFGWDGDWYLRGYFDDGTALGSRESQEAKIDSLPQSWAVISGAGNPERVDRAMRAVEEHLVLNKEALILLCTPPFDRSLPYPGYIMGYPPGVRENGGQYTHAALWVALAFARRGEGTRAARLLQMLNPIEKTRTPEAVSRYKGEPYVAAADVYSLSGHVGRAGWTWYTGASGWMYRIWLEEILGFKLRNDMLTLQPVLPADWPGYTMSFRYRSAQYDITVKNEVGDSKVILEVDGLTLSGTQIPLRDDGGTHQVHLRLGSANADSSSTGRMPAAAAELQRDHGSQGNSQLLVTNPRASRE